MGRRKAAAAPAGIRSRIVGEAEVDPDRLTDHPLNWRTHPGNQRAALDGALDELGWLQRVIVNRTTGHILDGHLRVELARAAGEPVPVVYVELEPEEELVILASVDPIGLLAKTDYEKRSALLDQVETENEALAALLHACDPGADAPAMPPEDNYREQFGLIVACDSHEAQAAAVRRLQASGYTAKAITV
jgi:hypothetical protein